MHETLVVVDSGPLIALAGTGHLVLLEKLHGTVAVPDAVWAEVVGEGGGRPGASLVESAPEATSFRTA